MYNNFFGFKEGPFKLVPNPAYLFLSKSHEEAMAHLNYAIHQGEGFVELTGEVGTGKTTLCRAFLEKIEKNTEAAYIFNPKLDSMQLLKAINDEFGISSDKKTIKDLIDTLNNFLMRKRALGKKVVLIIDEAQNLSNEVLEQLRLLSNLETNLNKLLQIILVGQPELKDMLDSYELRQLGQRISVSSHLIPLTQKETREYIQHRIHIASQNPGIKFTQLAFYFIYKFSRGIPRLINIVCNRALLTAFSLDQHKITAGIVRASIGELAGRGYTKRYMFVEGRNAVIIIALLCIALVIVTFYRSGVNNNKKTSGISESEIAEKSNTKLLRKKVSRLPTHVQKLNMNTAQEVLDSDFNLVNDLGVYLKALRYQDSRQTALKSAFALWNAKTKIKPHLGGIDDDQAFFTLAAKQNDLLIHRIKGNLKGVKKLNLPAILEFYIPAVSSPRYLTLAKIEGRQIIFKVKNDLIEVSQDEVEKYWSGMAYIMWNNFFSYEGTIPLTSTKDSIITLKMHLHDIGFNKIEISPVYDGPTKEAVKKIQKKYGLSADGIVGPLTKIVLYNEKKLLKIPHITN